MLSKKGAMMLHGNGRWFFAAVGLFLLLCGYGLFAAASTNPATQKSKDAKVTTDTKTATFAAGCFWGVQETFNHVPGVIKTEAGYIGGTTANPTYEDVCTNTTGYAEAVQVTYDPTKVSYGELLDAFWTCHNPTTLNRQGPDVGTQYRSAIFTHGADQEKIARESMKEVQDSGVFKKKIVTEIIPAGKFYNAEDYHQNYMAKHGGVCHTGIAHVKTKVAEEGKAAREAGK